ERLREIAEFYDISLVVLPGDDRPDPVLCSLGTVPLTVADKLWHYFVEGGAENLAYGLQYLAQTCLDYSYEVPEPQAVPQWGEYEWKRGRTGVSPLTKGGLRGVMQDFALSSEMCVHARGEGGRGQQPTVAIFFYRAHYLSGNTRVIDALCEALKIRGFHPLPLFLPSLRNPEIQAQLLAELTENQNIDLILNTTGFS
ncbi:MAG: cobaltochelatase subunit CobN, partial [Cyanobacteria bacterium J06639_14]